MTKGSSSKIHLPLYSKEKQIMRYNRHERLGKQMCVRFCMQPTFMHIHVYMYISAYTHNMFISNISPDINNSP